MLRTEPYISGRNYRGTKELTELIHEFKDEFGDIFRSREISALEKLLKESSKLDADAYDQNGLNKALITLKTALLFGRQVEPDHNVLSAILLYPFLREGLIGIDTISREWGDDIASLLEGITSVSKFSHKGAKAGYDNLRGLMVSLADDLRIIIIMIAHNLAVMREINTHPDQEWVKDVAFEAQYLYSQLAHRLGLYKLKGELEDLALKYTNREIYKSIAEKLNETKRSRDAYIESFIGPVKKKLEEAGLKFEIKGRTKSISSIWGKMKKQKTDLKGIYDLFAIRIILDSPGEKGKEDCWTTYSIIGNMYSQDESRMRDWLSFPKSNGYESLHTTVLGPDAKWVEVQIRTREMDEVAERGLAAHWIYKGGKTSGADQWMNNVREILENEENGNMALMKGVKPETYSKDIYAFTPKGQLIKLPPGATVLDFAFHIHSKVGAQCTGARINGQHCKLTHKLENGDTVEILTSQTQTPKQSWLDIVVSSKARSKIRQSLNEVTLRKAALGKEAFERRARNRKIEIEEALLMRLIKKEGYKYATEFFADIEEGKIDAGKFLNKLSEAREAENGEAVKISAGTYRQLANDEKSAEKSDASPLLIDGKAIAGIKYKLCKCCNPVFGDKIFGFFSSDGAIKIHKAECPNVLNISRKYPFRIVNVEWSGSNNDLYMANLKIVGKDDLGIVNNITSIISKDMEVYMRNLRVDSYDGMFTGYLTVSIRDLSQLAALIKKLSGVKGVMKVERI